MRGRFSLRRIVCLLAQTLAKILLLRGEISQKEGAPKRLSPWQISAGNSLVERNCLYNHRHG